MAELSISGRMLVKTLKSDFKKSYGLKYSPMFGQISQQVKMFFTAISFC